MWTDNLGDGVRGGGRTQGTLDVKCPCTQHRDAAAIIINLGRPHIHGLSETFATMSTLPLCVCVQFAIVRSEGAKCAHTRYGHLRFKMDGSRSSSKARALVRSVRLTSTSSSSHVTHRSINTSFLFEQVRERTHAHVYIK